MGTIAPAVRLRELLARPGVIRLAGAHNALGARIAEQIGFEGVWSSGLEISTAHAVPDASILTMSDYLAAAQQMVDAVRIPIVADCDTGYGNSNNVIRLVRQFESAGVAGVCIEDKLFPKVNSLTAGRQELAPVPEFVGKLLAAKTAQRTAEFIVIARIESLIAGWPVAEAIRRADAYVRAGADAILIHSKDATAGDIREFLARWDARVPVVVVPTAYPQITVGDLESLGVKVVVYANQGLRAAVCAMESTLRRIAADGSSANVEDSIAPMRRIFDLQGMPELRRAEDAYLRTGGPRTRAVILAAGAHRDAESMRALAEETPIAALDVSGRTLLQRQVETLARAGVRDVTVVTGHCHTAVRADGVELVHNADWATTGEAGSLLCVPDTTAPDDDTRTLVIYGDVLFDVELVAGLLRADAGITIVVDRGDPAVRDPGDVKQRDLVALTTPGRRFLSNGTPRAVARIGKRLESGVDGEFTGLALISAERWRAMRAEYRAAVATGAHAPLHEATAASRAALTDLLQREIDGGRTVASIEVASGWLEIHSFADYQRACRLVAR